MLCILTLKFFFYIKPLGCRNIEDRPDLDMDPSQNASHYNRSNTTGNISNIAGMKRSFDKMAGGVTNNAASNVFSNSSAANQANENQSCNFITQDVIDATIQCMIAQADECEKNGLPVNQTEKMVMEELGRCLVEIIDFSIRNTDTN